MVGFVGFHPCKMLKTTFEISISALLLNFRAKWLKEPNSEAEELFRMVAEVFIYWSKSHVSNSLINIF